MRWLMLAAALLVGACTTEVGPSQAEIKADWEAQNIYPENYRQDLLAFLRTYLNDPTHIRGAEVSQPFRKTVGPAERYIVCVRYDARKSDGHYGGPKDGVAVYVSAKLDRFLDAPKEVAGYCKEVVLSPFPELQNLTR
jgi:hypothetical protein